jgi:hypothetical protein
MALSYHPPGYMIKKAVEIVAEHRVIGEVEHFVADLERSATAIPALSRTRGATRSPSRGHGGIASGCSSRSLCVDALGRPG